jgi:hypothetical protein
MTSDDDRFPVAGEHKGVPLFAYQSPERLTAVRAEIDEVLQTNDPHELHAFARDISRSPEARLTAVARIEAIFEVSANHREARPQVNMPNVRAAVAGLGSRRWAHPDLHASLFDPIPPADSGQPLPVRRERPLTNEERGRD